MKRIEIFCVYVAVKKKKYFGNIIFKRFAQKNIKWDALCTCRLCACS